MTSRLTYTSGSRAGDTYAGASPTDVVINGKVEVYNRCLTDAPTQPYRPDPEEPGRPGSSGMLGRSASRCRLT